VVLNILVLVALGGLYLRPAQVIQVPVGASSGPEHYNAEVFYNTLTVTGPLVVDAVGQTKLTPTTGATVSLTAAQICDNSLIYWVPTAAQSTTTLPTAVALEADCLDVNGSSRTVYWQSGGANASTTRFTAGASTTIEYASSGQAIDGGDGISMTFINYSASLTEAGMVLVKIVSFND